MIKGKHLAPFMLFPAAPGTCQECAVKHDQSMPHNRDSLFYQYKFYNEHGRWPTWKDAMDHCTEEMKQIWIEALSEHGVSLQG